jgi:prepilin-type N-terminal cleavage/methylation domain-containing protein/prepilin-type processing-associated H-X9-DG protein
MQAIAAATLEGKPVDVDFGPSSGPALGGGGGGVGSWSGMIYIHRMQNGLSSNLDFGGSFSLSLPAQTQYDGLLTKKTMTKSSPPPAERAFTLIEFLVVVLAIGILAALAVPALNSAYERAKVTKDLSNLRQIGTATQLYMNDNNGAFPGSATVKWMSQLNPKYLSSWRVLESPFDKRATSELGNANTAVSYGINNNVYSSGAAISADKITKPVTFIVFAPAQATGATVTFKGAANSSAPGVTVNSGGTPATSNPGGTAVGGPHNDRQKINALFADWHAETMFWSGTRPAFTNNTNNPPSDADGNYRWNP